MSLCDHHFDKNHSHQEAFKISSLYSEKENTWSTYWKIFEDCRKNNKSYQESLIEAKKLGFTGPPLFVICLRSRLIQLGAFKGDEWFNKLLDEFILSPDIFHNSMGLSESVLENILREWLDKDKFNVQLQNQLRRLYLSSCKGSDFRYIVLNWKSFILETHLDELTKEQQQNLFNFFEYWSEILWISYQSHKVQQNISFQ